MVTNKLITFMGSLKKLFLEILGLLCPKLVQMIILQLRKTVSDDVLALVLV